MKDVNDLFQRLTVLAGFCNQTLTKEMLKFYDAVLVIYGYDKACDAVERTIKTRKGNERFPSPADLESLINPPKNADAEAIEAANRILGAVVTFGQYQDPKEYIGSLGWAVVQMNGGWQTVCRIAEENNTAIRSQFRECAKAIYLRSEQGIKTPPALPYEKERKGEIEPIGNIIALQEKN